MLLGVVISRNINDDDDDIWEYFSKYESKKSYFYKKKINFSIFNNVYGMRRTACNKSFFSRKYFSLSEYKLISEFKPSEYKLVSEFGSKSGSVSLTLYKSKSIIPNLNKNIEVTCESPLNQENNVIHFKLK